MRSIPQETGHPRASGDFFPARLLKHLGGALQAMSDQRHFSFGPDPNAYSVCPAAFSDQASNQSGPPSQTFIALSGTFR